MTDTEAPRAALSGERLAELMALLRGADTVELKLTIPESYRRSALEALEIDPLEAQLRQVYFFDTPDLTLNRAGVVVRARRIQGEFNDTVVKLRPVEPHQLPERLRKEPMFGVEVDAMPGGFVCSASYKGKLTGDEVPSVVKGTKGINKLFSKEQRGFYRENAPDGIAMNDLSILGPITVAKLKFAPTGYDRRLVAEMWFYPDGGRILELSTKTQPTEAFNAAMEARAFLFERGIDTTGEQQTKTKSALEFFSKELLASS